MRFIATLMLCLFAFLPSDADAKPRKKKIKKPDQLSVVLKELRDVRTELAKLSRKLSPDLPPPVIDYDVVPPSGNPVLSAPMPIPTIDAYKAHVEKSAKPVTGKIAGLKSYFLDRLKRMNAAMPGGMSVKVISGYRTRQQQATLHRAKPRLAAPPGRSKHEKGLAADLTYSSRVARRWVHRNAARFGLSFPMSYENWHIEPTGVTRTRYARAG